MTRAERQKRLRHILNKYDETAAHLRESREALRAQAAEQQVYLQAKADAQDEFLRMQADWLRTQNDRQLEYLRMHAARMDDANKAINEATNAMLAANREIQALFNEPLTEDDPS